MKTKLAALLASAALAAAGGALAAPAQPEIRQLAQDAPSPAARAEQLNFIAGDWTSPTAVVGFSRAQLNEIVGHLYIFENNTSGLHELWTIKGKGDSLALYQVFFNGDLTPRNEAKATERRLIAIDAVAGRAYFDGMTLTASGDALQIGVRLANGNVLTFNFTRVK